MDHDEYGPLPRGVNHIGLTVDDLDQASAFLAKGLGAQWCYDGLTTEDAPRQGPEAVSYTHLTLPTICSV